ncbi:MAG: PIN domain-containing protein [Cytophagales bacterium]|jgi:predicted nucleic acid-binding protein|nr:PIN domain-containing protein [Cytophagales bacterium]HMR58240.1 PIN domain-containing protein [Cyclobacteriaceae bacterium]
MNGNKLLLDTNIIIYLLAGDRTLADILHKKTIFISFITQLELLRYNELSAKQKLMVIDFLNQSTIIDINQEIKNNVVKLSKLYKLKLPDCIILSTGIHLDLPLLSSDKDLIKVKEVSVLYYEK